MPSPDDVVERQENLKSIPGEALGNDSLVLMTSVDGIPVSRIVVGLHWNQFDHEDTASPCDSQRVFFKDSLRSSLELIDIQLNSRRARVAGA
jgi:hypothetical protein